MDDTIREIEVGLNTDFHGLYQLAVSCSLFWQLEWRSNLSIYVSRFPMRGVIVCVGNSELYGHRQL